MKYLKKFEQHSDIDPYDEENWNDKMIPSEPYEKDHYVKDKLRDRDKNREKEIKKLLKCKIRVIKD